MALRLRPGEGGLSCRHVARNYVDVIDNHQDGIGHPGRSGLLAGGNGRCDKKYEFRNISVGYKQQAIYFTFNNTSKTDVAPWC